MTVRESLARMSTPARLLLWLSVALLPIGAALIIIADTGIKHANRALRGTAANQAEIVADALSGMIARNALALRLASNGALKEPGPAACDEARRTLAIAPAVVHSIELEDSFGTVICAVGPFADLDRPPLTAPGDIKLWVAADRQSLLLRTGVIDGSATTRLPLDELRRAVAEASPLVRRVSIEDDRLSIAIIDRPGQGSGRALVGNTEAIGNGDLNARIETSVPSLPAVERLLILLPVLMWALAAAISWWLVHRMLIGPLRRLQRRVSDYQPGTGTPLSLPDELGPASEIRQLGESFVRAVDRIDQSERDMAKALEGQRRLVREVHHRVKNNLQVVASLLSIHGRSADGPEAKAAYAAIGRRVDALSVVHRNHFAEMEDNQGIALRPMVAELGASLGASAPDAAHTIAIKLALDDASTTQDVAVAVAFLITEVVEHAMLAGKPAPVEIRMRRSSQLTAQLTMVSPVLLDVEEQSPARRQFERIVEGLARQLRSPLERNLGRYTVDLPVFPER